MTPGETKFLKWAFLILGATLTYSGWRTIITGHTRADGKEYEGKAAQLLGWLWIILGLLLILAAISNIAILQYFGKLFMESA